MLELTTIPDLRSWVRDRRRAALRIGFVPTMGYLHEGHLALVDEARKRADAVVMSVFVNPLQFGPDEDLDRYPRDLPRDRRLAASRGVGALFVPDIAVLYPPGAETRVVAGPTAECWEGAARPGHFAGVLTVVAKLFNLVQPDLACFGQKDYQQAVLVRRMVRDLDFPVEIVTVATVREPDGLALSSRNMYLSPAERGEALGLSRALQAAHEAWSDGETAAEVLERRMREVLEMHPGVAVEYIAIIDPESLRPIPVADGATVVAIAARVGVTRLIDNIRLGEGIR